MCQRPHVTAARLALLGGLFVLGLCLSLSLGNGNSHGASPEVALHTTAETAARVSGLAAATPVAPAPSLSATPADMQAEVVFTALLENLDVPCLLVSVTSTADGVLTVQWANVSDLPLTAAPEEARQCIYQTVCAAVDGGAPFAALKVQMTGTLADTIWAYADLSAATAALVDWDALDADSAWPHYDHTWLQT